jgi:hypothetical protein
LPADQELHMAIAAAAGVFVEWHWEDYSQPQPR